MALQADVVLIFDSLKNDVLNELNMLNYHKTAKGRFTQDAIGIFINTCSNSIKQLIDSAQEKMFLVTPTTSIKTQNVNNSNVNSQYQRSHSSEDISNEQNKNRTRLEVKSMDDKHDLEKDIYYDAHNESSSAHNESSSNMTLEQRMMRIENILLNKRNPKRKIRCFNCKQYNHKSNECKKNKVQCMNCHQFGHQKEFCKKPVNNINNKPVNNKPVDNKPVDNKPVNNINNININKNFNQSKSYQQFKKINSKRFDFKQMNESIQSLQKSIALINSKLDQNSNSNSLGNNFLYQTPSQLAYMSYPLTQATHIPDQTSSRR